MRYQNNIIKTITAYNKDEFIERLFPIVKDKFVATENPQLLETITVFLCKNKSIDKETLLNTVHILNECKTAELKGKLIDLIEVHAAESEIVVLPLFRCLSEESADVRNKCVRILSKCEHGILNDLNKKVLAGQGKMKKEDLEEIYNKVGFWINNNMETYKMSGKRIFDNISWYNLELKKDYEKPALMLNAVLEIYANKKVEEADLFDKFLAVLENNSNAKAKSLAIKNLANYKNEKERLTSLFINYLNHDAKIVRESCVKSLSALDSSWMLNPENKPKINGLIDQFIESNNDSSINAIIEIGEDSIPLLTARLEKAESRIMQENIIKVLDSLGDNARTSLPILIKLKSNINNAHTIKALKDLIAKLEE